MKELTCLWSNKGREIRIILKDSEIGYLVNFLEDNFKIKKREKTFLNNLVSANKILLSYGEYGCDIFLYVNEYELFHKFYSEESFFAIFYQYLTESTYESIVFSVFSKGWDSRRIFELISVPKIFFEQVLKLINKRCKKIKPRKKLIEAILRSEEVNLTKDTENLDSYILFTDSGVRRSWQINFETAEILWTFVRCIDFEASIETGNDFPL